MGLLCSSAAANHGAKCQGPSPSLLGVCFISPPLAISLVENRAPVSLDLTCLGSGAAFSLSAVIWGWERAGTAQLCVCVCVCWGGTGGRCTFQKEAGGGQRWATVPQQPPLAPAHVCGHKLPGDGLSFSRAAQGDASGKGPFWFLRLEGLLPLVLNQGPVPGTGGGGWECGAGGAVRGGEVGGENGSRFLGGY